MIAVVPGDLPGTWTWTCSRHGHPAVLWGDCLLATYDAMGHAAAHHPTGC